MTDRKQYLNDYMKNNYTQIRITIRKDDPQDQQIVDFLETKKDKSGFLKDLIRKEMKEESRIRHCLAMAGCRPLQELIEEIPGCYDTDDVIQKLDRMNTSRETNWLDWNGNTILAGDDREFLEKIARPDFNGTAEWYGINYCGEYEAIVKVIGYDWDDDDQTFLSMTEETIGWRRK